MEWKHVKAPRAGIGNPYGLSGLSVISMHRLQHHSGALSGARWGAQIGLGTPPSHWNPHCVLQSRASTGLTGAHVGLFLNHLASTAVFAVRQAPWSANFNIT